MQQERPSDDFSGRLLAVYTGAMVTMLIDIGHRTGLFEAVAEGPGTSAEISDRARLNERYVREWLGAMVTSDVVTYDRVTKTFALPKERAAFLTGRSSRNLAPMSRLFNELGRILPKVKDCFQQGGGVPYSGFRPHFMDAVDDLWRPIYEDHLIDGFLGAGEGLLEQLDEGIRVLDVGCGTGHAVNLMARAFPRSQFVGCDFAEEAIAKARTEASRMQNLNAHFEVLDIAQLSADPKFDLITAFDTIHDQRDAQTVLWRVFSALAPDGTFLMVDFNFASELRDNIGNPLAPLGYGISVMHCLTVSLAEGGDGLGTVWGIEKAKQMLDKAGFSSVQVIDSPRPQNCVFVCRK